MTAGTHSELANFIWSICNLLRGPYKRNEYRKVILPLTVLRHLAYLKPEESVCDVHYLRRVLDRAYPYLRSESDGGGSTKGAITCEQLANLKVPVPPLAEQRAIADFSDSQTLKIDRIGTKVEAAIERLLEYRTALITAAVTGKIDVRGTAA